MRVWGYVAGQGLGWQRTRVVACGAWDRMPQYLPEMTDESCGRALRLDSLLLPGNAQGGGY